MIDHCGWGSAISQSHTHSSSLFLNNEIGNRISSSYFSSLLPRETILSSDSISNDIYHPTKTSHQPRICLCPMQMSHLETSIFIFPTDLNWKVPSLWSLTIQILWFTNQTPPRPDHFVYVFSPWPRKWSTSESLSISLRPSLVIWKMKKKI